MQKLVNQTTLISLQLSDQETTKYPQALVRNSSGILVGTIDLLHTATGLYTRSYTPLVVGEYTIQYIVYSDSNHLVPDTIYDEISAESMSVTDSVVDDIWAHSSATQLLNDVALIKQIETGRWKIIDNQMIFYQDDNSTEVARFNLYDSNGQLSQANIFERRVA